MWKPQNCTQILHRIPKFSHSLLAVNLSDLILNLCPCFWHPRATVCFLILICICSFPADVFSEYCPLRATCSATQIKQPLPSPSHPQLSYLPISCQTLIYLFSVCASVFLFHYIVWEPRFVCLVPCSTPQAWSRLSTLAIRVRGGVRGSEGHKNHFVKWAFCFGLRKIWIYINSSQSPALQSYDSPKVSFLKLVTFLYYLEAS